MARTSTRRTTSSAASPTAKGSDKDLLEYIYYAIGARRSKEGEASARWKAAHQSTLDSANRPLPTPTGAQWIHNSSQMNGSALLKTLATNYTPTAVCNNGFEGLNNQLGQDPCYVARGLLDICTFGQPQNKYPLTPFSNGQQMYDALGLNQATVCACTVPVYNLVAACGECQLAQDDNAVLPWRTYAHNCSNSALVDWPYPTPNWTIIPDWAYANVSDKGWAFNLAAAFAVSQNKSDSNAIFSSVNPAQTVTSTSASITATATNGQANGNNPHRMRHATFVSIIAGTVVTTLACVGLVAALTWFILRRRRAARQGQRLPSTSDLHEKDDGFRQGGAVFRGGAGGDMSEKNHSHVSLFLPTTESVFSSRTGTSFMTNSVSSRSYTESEFDGTETEDSASLMSMNEDDISPFANIHRAPSQRTSISLSAPGRARFASRNNLHNYQRESGSTWMTSETGRIVPGSSRRGGHLAPDARSLLSQAPSSTGATWGRELEEDDELEEDEDEQTEVDGRTLEGSEPEGEGDEDESDGDDEYERRFIQSQNRGSTLSLTSP